MTVTKRRRDLRSDVREVNLGQEKRWGRGEGYLSADVGSVCVDRELGAAMLLQAPVRLCSDVQVALVDGGLLTHSQPGQYIRYLHESSIPKGNTQYQFMADAGTSASILLLHSYDTNCLCAPPPLPIPPPPSPPPHKPYPQKNELHF